METGKSIWGFFKKNIIIIIIGIVSLCLLGVVAVAATLLTSDDVAQNDLAIFGQTGKRNPDPPAQVTVADVHGGTSAARAMDTSTEPVPSGVEGLSAGGDSAASETIYDIAQTLKIPFYDLVIENRITGELPLVSGSTLLIPRYQSDFKSGRIPPEKMKIHADRQSGVPPLAVRLSSDVNLDSPGLRYVWDLGNNRFSFDSEPEIMYIRPGIYNVRLVAVDATGRYSFSDKIAITVTDIQADYQGLPYITMDRVGDYFSVEGRVTDTDGKNVDFDSDTIIEQNPPLLKYLWKNIFQSTGGGFSKVRLVNGKHSFEFYLFVSPIPARLSVEPEYDWYKTQYKTGMYGNCGPASNASAIKWAIGKDLSVEDVRREIGMPYTNGAVDYFNLLANLKSHSIKSEIQNIGALEDIFRVIDSGGIVIVGFNCGSVKPTRGNKQTDFIGRYYPDATGHYLLIKGYSLDRKLLVVYDAIPGEWKKNEIRYTDGVSMIGRNRFFPVDEVMLTIGGMQMLDVWRTVNDTP
jgi:PKD repeat protein